MANKLIIAAAGSGKTTLLVNQALAQNCKVLITTFTQANETEIRKKIIEINKCIPENIVVQTWFAFLLKHGVRPYQGKLINKRIKGLIFINGISAQYTKEETQFEQHFFSREMKIYSDKLSKFVIRAQEKSEGALINRLSKIYSNIFIDEVQDLAGYDLEILKLLFSSISNVTLVGDPRQATYSTSNSAKNKKFQKSNIVDFFGVKFDIETDDTSLIINYRCHDAICKLSNKLFTDFSPTSSGNDKSSEHDGVFFIKTTDVDSYLEKYKPIQLRDSKRTTINEVYNVMNFGESKGLSFERALIYPTNPIKEWLVNNNSDLAPTSRSKFYVALTRARQSVGIIYDYDNKTQIEGISLYNS